ncbi:MAG: AAA family ATPase [Chitinivibrionales bacterium]|nr:AAA family ATPase [Chitinivibrionales bacterium]MBD3359060.1 AAA family ATPase [Chitinivibrionales bacterium]
MNRYTKKQPVLDRIVLNSIQKQAVSCDIWPQLVFAGAGSGKTRVLTAKIAYLIEHLRVPPINIFAATFTNKAAGEMRERVESLTGLPCGALWIGTFHSMCARLLRREAPHIGYPANFTIYDRDDQISLVKRILKEEGLDERSMPPRGVLQSISRFKNACTPFESIEGGGDNYYDRQVIHLYGIYQKMLKRSAAMDFDDLIANAVYLLRGNADILKRYQNRFQYVLVDEYQDTNNAQFLLVKLLGAAHKRVFVVGDDDQSIYGWRGAQVENILSFESLFEGTRVFKLEQNYRSTQPILDFAHSVISVNTNRADKQLWTDTHNGAEVAVTRYRDDRQEATGIAERVAQLAANGMRLGEVAVLFRTNAQSRVLEEALRRAKLPYVVVGATSFYQRKEIKDCLAYLRLLINPRDDVSCARVLNVPTRGIGAKSQASLFEAAAKRNVAVLELIEEQDGTLTGGKAAKGVEQFREIMLLLRDLVEQQTPPDEILKQILDLTGYTSALEAEDTVEAQNRLDNIGELVNALTLWAQDNPEGTLADFLEEVSLVSDVDKWERRETSVNLMTLHCAKGLEFGVVFLAGLEDGLLPSRQNFDDERSIEEERRLLYVGATRARKELCCSFVDQRYRFGRLIPMEPSRYLDDIPRERYRFDDRCVTFSAPPAAVSSAPKAKKPRMVAREEDHTQETSYDDFSQEIVQYRMGHHVSHKSYGRGKILSVSGFGKDTQLTVLFSDGSRRKLMAKFLEPEVW